jgi:hypothetical protein
MIPMMGGLTTGSTRPLDSFSFMVAFSDNIECFMLAAGYPGRWVIRLSHTLKRRSTNGR